MKRTRTLSIEIEQRKLTLTVSLGGPAVAPPATGSGPLAPLCPECQTPWTTFTFDAALPTPKSSAARCGSAASTCA